MPFKSLKQERFMFAKHPRMANQWEKDEKPSFGKLDSYFDGGKVKGPSPEQLKALSDVEGLRKAIATNLDPDVKAIHNSKNDPSLEVEGGDYKGNAKDQSYAEGGKVPGRPLLPGDHPKNDTILAKVSPGEVVLPNSVTSRPGAPDRAKKFMKLNHYFGGNK